MIGLLMITSIFLFFGVPSLVVLCACITASRADHQEQIIALRQLPVHHRHVVRENVFSVSAGEDLAH